jgi:hypothetical protein
VSPSLKEERVKIKIIEFLFSMVNLGWIQSRSGGECLDLSEDGS